LGDAKFPSGRSWSSENVLRQPLPAWSKSHGLDTRIIAFRYVDSLKESPRWFVTIANSKPIGSERIAKALIDTAVTANPIRCPAEAITSARGPERELNLASKEKLNPY